MFGEVVPRVRCESVFRPGGDWGIKAARQDVGRTLAREADEKSKWHRRLFSSQGEMRESVEKVSASHRASI